MRRSGDHDDLPSADIAIREIYEPANGLASADPRPRRRWPAALVTAVLVLAVARLVAGQQHAGPPAAAPDSAGRTSAAAPTSTVPTAAGTSAASSTALSDSLGIPVLRGSPGPAPAGLRLLVSGPTVPGILDVDTDRRSPLTGLSIADQHRVQPPQLVALPGGDAVLVYTDLSGNSGRIYLADQQGRARLIAAGAAAQPGADGSILVTRYDPVASTDPNGPSQTLSAIDRQGGQLWSHPVPGNSAVLAGTRRGVLLAVYHPDGLTVRIALLDPDTGLLRDLGTGSAGLSADDRHALWLSTGCSQQAAVHCLLMVTDLATGASRGWPVSGNGPSVGLIAPDGRSVALAWFTTFGSDGNAIVAGHLDIMDLATGRSSRAPGVAPALKRLPSLAWLPDSRTVLLALAWPDHWRIASWHAGDPRPTSWPGSVASIRDDQQLLLMPAGQHS